jgi:hypothetical protein
MTEDEMKWGVVKAVMHTHMDIVQLEIVAKHLGVIPREPRHDLSRVWRTVLEGLRKYPFGIDKELFCSIMGDGEHSHQATTKIALDQMFFKGPGYWEWTPDGTNIRITKRGIEALDE